MKAKNSNKKVVNSYIKQLKSAVICSSSMKKAFISEIKHQIAELENENKNLSLGILHREIGYPDEIARGFESRDDIIMLKEKAKKYTRAKIICWIALGLALVTIVGSAILIQSNDDYYSKTYSDTTIKELD